MEVSQLNQLLRLRDSEAILHSQNVFVVQCSA